MVAYISMVEAHCKALLLKQVLIGERLHIRMFCCSVGKQNIDI
ncbi:14441_t:CDS:2 [Entrophospora sp. SA101]|nr:14441_t:CDS:2 [Entrophospora sp. SA101]